jgi:hypothetical protein
MNATDTEEMCPSFTRVLTACPWGVEAKVPRTCNWPVSLMNGFPEPTHVATLIP